jgi:hypothetical protein
LYRHNSAICRFANPCSKTSLNWVVIPVIGASVFAKNF